MVVPIHRDVNITRRHLEIGLVDQFDDIAVGVAIERTAKCIAETLVLLK